MDSRLSDVHTHYSLHSAISLASVAPGPLLWRLVSKEGFGRVLVAACDLPAGTLVCSERPLVVAPVAAASSPAALRGEAQAVAVALLESPVEAAALLCSPAHGEGSAEAVAFDVAADAFAAAWSPATPPPWSQLARRSHRRHWLGVASVNVHAAERPARGVLGLLTSMMQHDCTPSAHVGSEAGGSLLSLRTCRDVAQGGRLSISYVRRSLGEPLSISYVVSYQPTADRRAQLLSQHGFRCACHRCEQAPELSWAELLAAERSSDLGECMRRLHPYHHKMAASPSPEGSAQRSTASNPLDPLAAADLERAAVCYRAAGDAPSAARLFCSAEEGFALAR
ncbi:hypothetical protein EMIHUDRAFT_449623 [Emiliania huxleyi CCMP1516]|uniref:SET domain-containing protein n=2 Tax=Emiliania huxleyi TaxID=2903 RepID=A0A0D3K5G0_EMIH1|nr:hypothetical protein EMIHUDRAFT_449623 [Emiliania huxleyi CCMP1516]EOD30995.1 hypothetical protein EMIHUDRAFT_449623 [Emiliania huxleyi CCMP1516]|eukprot:XP_005783424.1 hypothetical protein EMIHUDRAFT_449623 [Emiliania huxleyi CCMP1516]